MRYRFPKIFCIRKKADFQRLRRKGKRLVGCFVCMDYCKHPGSAKMGISVPARFGRAHERNRFKRIAREAFRLMREDFGDEIHIHLIPRKLAKQAKMQDIQKEFLQFIAEIKYETKPLAEPSCSSH